MFIMTKMSRLLAFSTVLALLFEFSVGTNTCYYPDGSVANDYAYVPCTGSQYSTCCNPSEGDVCLSNGLCYWQGHFPYRAACTGLFRSKILADKLTRERSNVAILELHK